MGISGAATLLYQGCIHVVHTHLVLVVLDHQGEKPDLDRNTGPEELGTNRCILLWEQKDMEVSAMKDTGSYRSVSVNCGARRKEGVPGREIPDHGFLRTTLRK